MPSFDDIRIVLVQARSTPDIETQEQQCFLERSRVRPSQLRALNVLRDDLDDDVFEQADVLMIGGAGEYSATEHYEWMPDLLDLIRDARERRFPTFGSCWGHQLIARALGGTVVHDTELAEIGCYHVSLTSAGKKDHLFGDFPRRFLANMGHHDRVVELPRDGVELASSDTQANQAFRIVDHPMYCTQFHSELDARRERERLYKYRDHYPEVAGDASFQAVLDNLTETSEVDHLLYDFLIKIVV